MQKEQLDFIPFSDSLMFSLVMQDPKKCAAFLERLFPGEKIGEVRFPDETYLETEKTIIPGMDSKTVRLDALFSTQSKWFDIEMQVGTEKNLALRSRYYHCVMDVNHLHRGEEYDTLKPTYVIFLCAYDPCGLGKYMYSFQNFDIENHLPMNDLAFTIYLNTKCKPENVPEELRELYRYINLQKKAGNLAAYDGQDKFVQEIHAKVQELNEGRGLSSVMTWEQETRRQVRQAKEENKLATARRMKAKGYPAEEIAEICELTPEEVAKL